MQNSGSGIWDTPLAGGGWLAVRSRGTEQKLLTCNGVFPSLFQYSACHSTVRRRSNIVTTNPQ